MNPRKHNIDTITDENIKLGRFECVHYHRSVDGGIYRLLPHGHCFGCYFKLPDGVYSNTFPEVQKKKKESKYTKEEISKKQSAASMRWAAKNKDKTREYQRKYEKKRYALIKAKREELKLLKEKENGCE